MAISPESHRETTGIHLHERTFTFISNVLLHPRAGGALKYNLFGVLKESAFEGVVFLLKGGGILHTVFTGALGFKWEVEQVVCVLAVTHSCCWPRAGDRDRAGSF